MPKSFRHTFIAEGKVICYRKRKRGKVSCSYEARYRRNGFNISVSATTLEELKTKFIEKLNNQIRQEADFPEFPKDFNGFAYYWFENFHKAKVSVQTYENNLALFNRHVKARFENKLLATVTPVALKELITSLPGNGKTADDVHSILNQIFETAVTHGLARLNPLNLFVHIQHERETGIELTRSEETELLYSNRKTDYEIIFAVILYCGLRPNEYNTARIEGNFIVAVNSKRKNGKIEYKNIPICSPLRPYLNGVTELPKRHEATIRDVFNKFLPKHTLKDLRKTFNTRCVECGVDVFARKKFMGHSVGKLDRTYTGTLENFLLNEVKKLDKWYSAPNFAPNND